MLQLDRVNAGYDKHHVLSDISLNIEDGEIVAVIGANSSGKSTLLKTISGILKPYSGSITFGGVELTKLQTHKIADLGITYVQEGKKIFPSFTVLENLKMGSTLPRARKKREESLELVLKVFPVLKERSQDLAEKLSGGQKQMLVIAMGFMSSPKLMLLDECSQGLAPIVMEEVYDTILHLHQEYGLSILMVEQNVFEALSIADRGYVLENGRKRLEGTARDLLAMEEIKKVYLGM